MLRVASSAAIVLLAMNSLAQANPFPYSPASCAGTVLSINGVVTSTPANPADPAARAGCQDAKILGELSYENGDPIADPVLDPPLCLRIDASGSVKASGYSQLTSVEAQDEQGASAVTPFCFPFDPTRGCGVPQPDGSTLPYPATSAGLTGFTSQVALVGSVQGNKYRGTFYTKDTGYITADGFVGQVLLIVGGTNDFAGATGRVAVAGQEVGGFATYTGHVCIQD
jgi:hypothetical protein